MKYFNGEFPFFEEGFRPEILKKNIDRAIHDLLLNSFRNQSDEFIFIFNDSDEIESLSHKMITYWEAQENYEICSEVVTLKEKLKGKLKNIPSCANKAEDEINTWFTDQF
jgi:hypothetical protein